MTNEKIEKISNFIEKSGNLPENIETQNKVFGKKYRELVNQFDVAIQTILKTKIKANKKYILPHKEVNGIKKELDTYEKHYLLSLATKDESNGHIGPSVRIFHSSFENPAIGIKLFDDDVEIRVNIDDVILDPPEGALDQSNIGTYYNEYTKCVSPGIPIRLKPIDLKKVYDVKPLPDKTEEGYETEEQHKFLNLAQNPIRNSILIEGILKKHPKMINVQPLNDYKARKRSALHQAAEFGNAEVVKMLLDRGADPLSYFFDHTEGVLKTPRDVAKSEEIKSLLKTKEDSIYVLVEEEDIKKDKQFKFLIRLKTAQNQPN